VRRTCRGAKCLDFRAAGVTAQSTQATLLREEGPQGYVNLTSLMCAARLALLLLPRCISRYSGSLTWSQND